MNGELRDVPFISDEYFGLQWSHLNAVKTHTDTQTQRERCTEAGDNSADAFTVGLADMTNLQHCLFLPNLRQGFPYRFCMHMGWTVPHADHKTQTKIISQVPQVHSDQILLFRTVVTN